MRHRDAVVTVLDKILPPHFVGADWRPASPLGQKEYHHPPVTQVALERAEIAVEVRVATHATGNLR